MARGKRSEPIENGSVGEIANSLSGNVADGLVNPGEIDAADNSGSGENGGRDDEGAGTVRYNKDGSIRKKRGPNKTKASSPVLLDVHAIQFSLSGIHSLLAIALSAPEMELTEPEAEILAKNVGAVARHYDIVTTQKSIDLFNLVMAGTTIYGSRLIVIGKRKAQEATQKRQGVPRNHPGPLPMPTQIKPAGGAVNGAAPPVPATTRPATPEDKAMLDELPLIPSGSMQSH